MKVFAHYYDSDETGNNYRWRTLLHFGTSWDIIGSVVMKNPGSAEPHNYVHESTTHALKVVSLYGSRCFHRETDVRLGG